MHMKIPAKATVLSSVAAAALIAASLFLGGGGDRATANVPANNVSVVDGIQIVEIQARGGYWPRKSVAKAGLPTVLRFNASGSFDCSSVVRIASLDVSENLPQSGFADIEVGTRDVSTLEGSCGMGMYPFEVEFEP